MLIDPLFVLVPMFVFSVIVAAILVPVILRARKPPRVEMDAGYAGWRDRCIGTLVKAFSLGKLTLPDYESQLDVIVRATEPEALAIAAKSATSEDDRQRAEAARKGEAGRRRVAAKLLLTTLRSVLQIDATPYLETLHMRRSGWCVTLGDVFYGVTLGGSVVRVVKKCPTCPDDIEALDGAAVVNLASLGRALAELESMKHCGSLVCALRAKGWTEEHVAKYLGSVDTPQMRHDELLRKRYGR